MVGCFFFLFFKNQSQPAEDSSRPLQTKWTGCVKAGGRKNNTKALLVAETERTVLFIKQYAEDHARPCPRFQAR